MLARALMLTLLVTACGKSDPPAPVVTKPAVAPVNPTTPLTPCEQTCKTGCVHAGDKEAGKWSAAPELEKQAADVDIKFCEAKCSMDKCLVHDALAPK